MLLLMQLLLELLLKVLLQFVKAALVQRFQGVIDPALAAGTVARDACNSLLAPDGRCDAGVVIMVGCCYRGQRHGSRW